MAQAKKLVSLTATQFNTLVTDGTITVNGVTIEFNENDIYLTPQPSYYEQVDGVVMPSTAGTLATQEWVNANGGKIYEHNIACEFTDSETGRVAVATLTVPSKSAIAFTKEQVSAHLLAKNGLVNASVIIWDGASKSYLECVGALLIYDNTRFTIVSCYMVDDYIEISTTDITSVTDNVIDTSTI